MKLEEMRRRIAALSKAEAMLQAAAEAIRANDQARSDDYWSVLGLADSTRLLRERLTERLGDSPLVVLGDE